jgi:hypothetical protein
MLRKLRLLVFVLLASATMAGSGMARCVVVSDGGDNGGPNATGYDGGGADSLAVAAYDTSATYSLKTTDKVVLWVQANCDTAALTVQVSYDGTVWSNLVNAVLLDGTPGSTVCVYNKTLCTLLSGESDYDAGPVGTMMRMIIKSNDSTTGHGAVNGLKNLKYYMRMINS